MSRPVEIGHYVAFVTETSPGDNAKLFFARASAALPTGVRTTVQVEGENGGLTPVAMVVRHDQKYHCIIPLTRDLMSDELETVVDAVSEIADDFDITASQTIVEPMRNDPRAAEIDKVELVNLCIAWAKRDHEHWMKTKAEQGWRHGMSVSTVDKTHPLMRPWEELPDQYRNIDVDRPQAMLDLLNDQGFSVVKRSELDAIIRLLRKK